MFEASIIWKGILYAALMTVAKSLTATVIYFDYFNSSVKAQCQTESSNQPPSDLNSNTNAPAQTPPHSIAFLVGMAMVARGEIGFLIASLSQSSRVFILQVRTSNLQPEDEQIFLVVVWSVVLCTIIGPIGVGLIVRRLRQRNDCVQQSKWTRE
jgi:Kef-type K+ transport system membrane component KefB